MEGVVLQTYGAGNVPDTKAKSYLIEELKNACDRGIIVVNCTQCSRGVVTEMYAGGIVRPHPHTDYVITIMVCLETPADWGSSWTRHDNGSSSN